MRLKTDENLGRDCISLLRAAGHDVATVAEEGLTSAPDADVIAAATHEGRCLVTLDLDFGNPLVFKPSQYAGIAVLRLPPRPALADLQQVVTTFIETMAKEKVAGHLWVVQRNRVRVYREGSQ